jgi:alpha-glucosidase
MLRLEEVKEGFKIFFKEKLYFEHKKDCSLLIVGVGKAKYEMSHGKFTITQEIFSNIHLTKYKIKKNNKKNLVLELSNNNISVNFKLISKNHQLYLFFNCNDKKINRFNIKIVAPKDEKIYGCGAQLTKFNLKGHKVPLWVEESNPLWKDNFTTYFPQTSFISIDMESFNSYFLFLETSYYSEFDFRNMQYNELLVWEVPEKIVIGTSQTNNSLYCIFLKSNSE